MTKLLVLSFVYVWLFKPCCPQLHSDYVKTRVLEDDYSCIHSEDSYHGLLYAKTNSLISCTTLCSSVDDCRRVLFDSGSRMCHLYRAGEDCLTAGDIQRKVCYRQKSLCNETACPRCPVGYYGDRCEYIIQDCSDGANKGVVPNRKLRSYIKPDPTDKPIEVTCDFEWGGLTFILTRLDSCRELDFNRTWQEYSDGFGAIANNYWIGLRHVNQMLRNYAPFTLTVQLMLKSESGSFQGHYKDFTLGDASTNYTINLGSFRNNTNKGSGDSLTGSGYDVRGRPFSTYDRDYTSHDCPGRFHGGWWYPDNQECGRANLVGHRSGSTLEETWHWRHGLGNTTDYSLMAMFIKRL